MPSTVSNPTVASACQEVTIWKRSDRRGDDNVHTKVPNSGNICIWWHIGRYVCCDRIVNNKQFVHLLAVDVDHISVAAFSPISRDHRRRRRIALFAPY